MLDGVEPFVEILLGGPFEAVVAAEAVGGDAEVIDEAADADGAAAVEFLLYGEPDGHDVSGGKPASGAA